MTSPSVVFTPSRILRLDCGPSAGNQLEYQCYERQNEQQVNESTQGVAAHHPYQPQNKKNHKNCPKHVTLALTILLLPSLLRWKPRRGRAVVRNRGLLREGYIDFKKVMGICSENAGRTQKTAGKKLDSKEKVK
jgi:hypothetical protein